MFLLCKKKKSFQFHCGKLRNQPLQVSVMPSSQPQEISLQIFIIQNHVTPDHKRKFCALYIKAPRSEKGLLSALGVFSQNLHKLTTNHNVNQHTSDMTVNLIPPN